MAGTRPTSTSGRGCLFCAIVRGERPYKSEADKDFIQERIRNALTAAWES